VCCSCFVNSSACLLLLPSLYFFVLLPCVVCCVSAYFADFCYVCCFSYFVVYLILASLIYAFVPFFCFTYFRFSPRETPGGRRSCCARCAPRWAAPRAWPPRPSRAARGLARSTAGERERERARKNNSSSNTKTQTKK